MFIQSIETGVYSAPLSAEMISRAVSCGANRLMLRGPSCSGFQLDFWGLRATFRVFIEQAFVFINYAFNVHNFASLPWVAFEIDIFAPALISLM
jgi:hypothetical protein